MGVANLASVEVEAVNSPHLVVRHSSGRSTGRSSPTSTCSVGRSQNADAVDTQNADAVDTQNADVVDAG